MRVCRAEATIRRHETSARTQRRSARHLAPRRRRRRAGAACGRVRDATPACRAGTSLGQPLGRGREGLRRARERRPEAALRARRHRRLGEGDLHHRRHRAERRRHERGPHGVPARGPSGGGALRRRRGATPTPTRMLHLLKIGATPARAARPGEARASSPQLAAQARRHVRQGQVVRPRPSPGKAPQLPRHPRRPRTSPKSRDRPTSCSTRGRAGTRISPRHEAAYARFVELANKGARGDRLRGPRRSCGGRLRHAARGVREGDRPPLGQVKPLYDAAPLLRARAGSPRSTADKVADGRAHPGPPARQHVGAGVGQHLPAGRAVQGQPARSTSPPRSKRKKYDAHEDGEAGRGVLHLARLRSAAARRSGSGRCSRSRATARSSATRAPGTSRPPTTCASRCASSRTEEDLITIHHELGHNYYYHALLQAARCSSSNGANDGFHEAHRRHHRALDHARVPEEDRACSTQVPKDEQAP